MSKLCECGCGEEVVREEHRFLYGHHYRGKHHSKETKLKIAKHRKGGIEKGGHHSEETKLKISRNNKRGMLGKKVSEETRLKLSLAGKGKKVSEETRLKIIRSLTGKHHSEETKLKISKNHGRGMLGKKSSKETRLRLSKNYKGMIGKHHSEEVKLKMSISHIKYLEKTVFNGGPMFPGIGNNEIPILNRIQNESYEEILRNDHDISMKVGKFPDGYIKKYNLCIDVLEPFHFKVTGELSDNDQKRELRIAWKLGCMIYYIPEQEFLTNPDKEIQRFKDFLLILKDGSN